MTAAMEPAIQMAGRVFGKLCAGIFLSSAIGCVIWAQPADLAKRVAAREAEAREARSHYTYRQSVDVDELSDRGMLAGTYKEVRDVIFSPTGERTEQFVEEPMNHLKRLSLTSEDFRDIREIQPFLFTTDELWLYETHSRGGEMMDGIDCWKLEVRPRQELDGMRLFEGMFWVDKSDFSVIRSSGVAVPQMLNRDSQNLFPRFTTTREKVDGKYWFPVATLADDVLPFTTGALHMRMEIRYSDYKRFSASSSITFGGTQP